MELNTRRKLIAVVGPTASGKTAVGVRLAKEFDGEIVSADSRQVYRGLDLGTGKDLGEYGGIKYHLIDIKDPGEKFTLFDYLPLARKAIDDIFARGKVPIIVGGTGLYIQALIEGFALSSEQDTANRIQQSREYLNNLTVEQLQSILKELNIEVYENLVDKQNPHRLIRAIERAQSGEVVIKKKPDIEALQIGLDWPREELYKRIDERIDERFDQGMLNEAEGLLKAGVDAEWLFNLGLEYRMMVGFLILNDQLPTTNKNEKLKIEKMIENCKLKNENFESFDAMRQTLKFKSHQYAKRQLTWFRRFPEIIWHNDVNKLADISRKFLEG